MKSLTKASVCALFAFTVSGLLSAGTTFAQVSPTNVELSQLVPADTDTYIEFNTSAKNPFTETFTQGFLAGFSEAAANQQDPQKYEAVKEIMMHVINSNTYATAIKSNADGTKDTYLAAHLSNEDYNKIKALFPQAPQTEPNFSYIGNLVVITSSPELNTKMMDLYKNGSGALAQNENYQLARSKDFSDSFLNIYINPSAQFQNMTAMPELEAFPGLDALLAQQKDLLNAIKTEGISIAQSSTGFNFSVYAKGDGQKLLQLNMSFDRYNFIPELYKFIKGQNVISFAEQSNLWDGFKSYLDSMAIKTWLKNELNIDADQDLANILKEKSTFSIHKTDQLLPAVSFMLDVRKNPQTSTLLNKFVDYIDKKMNEMEKTEGFDFYNKTTTNLNGVTFNQMTFDAGKFPNSELKAVLTLNAGITHEGFLLITTAPNPADVYTLDGQGMQTNAVFNAAFTNRQEPTAGVSYVSFDNLHSYINMVMTTMSAPQETFTLVDGLLNPWHDLYSKSYGMIDNIVAKGFVNVDVDGLSKYSDLFKQFSSNFDMTNMPMVSDGQFCDVSADDWFSSYVSDLSDNGIIQGYNDGCFRPEKQITRAEFIKMAMASAGMAGDSYRGAPFFKDVKADGSQWYSDAINMAAARKLVNGYSDGSFHPNALITRAEAIQILYNMSNSLKNANYFGAPINDFVQFDDVTLNDWYMPAVAAAYQNDLIQGESSHHFAPGRNLTRAEAAKIISIFRGLMLNDGTPGEMPTPSLNPVRTPTPAIAPVAPVAPPSNEPYYGPPRPGPAS